MNDLVETVCAPLSERVAGRHVLLLEDTTELNYQAHAGRVKGLGTVGNGRDSGLFLHPVLAVDAEDFCCLGLGHLHLWQRFKAKAANYKQLPIEEKESHRWLDAPQQALKRIQGAARATVIADREADIYEMFHRLPEKGADLLIRVCRNRRIQAPDAEQTQHLYDWLVLLPEAGRYRVQLPALPGKRQGREALLQVRFSPLILHSPTTHKEHSQCQAWAIEVREDASSVPANEEPVLWRLLTTHEVQDLAQARQCIDWYRQRWHIEQLFRTLKRQGLNVEASEIEHAERLEKLVVLATYTAVRTLQLTLARDGQSDRPDTDCFGTEDRPLLEQLCQHLEGKTQKQRNPHAPHSLAWCAWIIARLGGWGGYASERKPGPITMFNGLNQWQRMREGWLMAASLMGKDVCTP
ncbi:Transposase for transposon Tn5 [compost metagenome]